MGASVAVFIAGAVISLGTSWLLVSRLERVGERLGVSEALLGLIAALAADGPEITSAVSAMAHRDAAIGAGVVIGSNVFNLAALLGLGAVVAGRIVLHRRVIELAGVVAAGVAAVCLVVVLGLIPPGAGLALVLAVLVPYGLLLGLDRSGCLRLPLPVRWRSWLAEAVAEEEEELAMGVHPGRGGRADVLLAAAALVVVVVASVGMEEAAANLGRQWAIPGIVTGGIVLAAVTSIPNAVAAFYLATRGRGAAVLSTALNSNALNVAIGLLVPATIVGLSGRTAAATVIAAWYLALTVLALSAAYVGRGLRRGTGAAIIGGYLAFLGSLLLVVRG